MVEGQCLSNVPSVSMTRRAVGHLVAQIGCVLFAKKVESQFIWELLHAEGLLWHATKLE